MDHQTVCYSIRSTDQLEGVPVIPAQLKQMLVTLDQLEGILVTPDQLEGVPVALDMPEGVLLTTEKLEEVPVPPDHLEVVPVTPDQLEGQLSELPEVVSGDLAVLVVVSQGHSWHLPVEVIPVK